MWYKQKLYAIWISTSTRISNVFSCVIMIIVILILWNYLLFLYLYIGTVIEYNTIIFGILYLIYYFDMNCLPIFFNAYNVDTLLTSLFGCFDHRFEMKRNR